MPAGRGPFVPWRPHRLDQAHERITAALGVVDVAAGGRLELLLQDGLHDVPALGRLGGRLLRPQRFGRGEEEGEGED